MSHTFAVSQVARASGPLALDSLAEALHRLIKTPVEASASNASMVLATELNPFVAAVHLAFAQHYPLVLTPDAIWLCLAQGLATHVGLHADSLRQQFVQHVGRQVIEVRRDDFIKGSKANPWPEVLSEFSDAIAGRTVGNVRELIVCNFSTTGPVERTASELTLMSALRSYFEYHVTTLCGIPAITLAGTIEDWQAIRGRAAQLAVYGLDWWVKELLPVLDQFVAAAAGRVDGEFWRSFFKENDESGGPYITGWINVFLPYLYRDFGPKRRSVPNPLVARWKASVAAESGGIPLDSLPLGLSCAPFQWQVLRDLYPMELLGGFVGIAQDPGSLAVSPAIGWAVRDAPPAE